MKRLTVGFHETSGCSVHEIMMRVIDIPSILSLTLKALQAISSPIQKKHWKVFQLVLINFSKAIPGSQIIFFSPYIRVDSELLFEVPSRIGSVATIYAT